MRNGENLGKAVAMNAKRGGVLEVL